MELKARATRFRQPKLSSEEGDLLKQAIAVSTKYKNKWPVNIFSECQRAREINVPVLDCGGLFKDYDLHKVKPVIAEIEEMDAVTLNYWLSKLVMEVAKISGEG